MFSINYVILQLEIDDEVDEGTPDLAYFEKVMVETFRNAIGELGMPKYDNYLKKNEGHDTIFKTINVYLIWLNFFCQTYLMQIIMLNFMIAVIMTTYEGIINGNRQ